MAGQPVLIWFLVLRMLCTAALGHHSHSTGAAEEPSDSLIKLIVKSYVDNMLNNPTVSSRELQHRLSGISKHIARHPALHQRYLWVGSEPPPADYNPDRQVSTTPALGWLTDRPIQILERTSAGNLSVTSLKMKRKNRSDKLEQLPSEEICETKEKWEQIDMTHDMFENKVKVIQEKDMQQFVFSYRCAHHKAKCLGISPMFESECAERYGWMYMYYKPEDKPPQWGFVNAPHHCSCKLKPKLFNGETSTANGIER